MGCVGLYIATVKVGVVQYSNYIVHVRNKYMSATYKLVFGIVIDAVQGIFIFFFDSLPSHVPFGSRAG